MLQKDITNFKQLSQFQSLKDFNNNVEMWLADHKEVFTKKELIILKRLIRYSAKVYGVSNVSIRRLIKTVEQCDNITVSMPTFHRMKRKAIKLGMLTVHATKREDNSQSSNIYVFNAYNTNNKSDDSTNNDSPIQNAQRQQTASNQQLEKREMIGDKTDKNYKTNIKKHRNENDICNDINYDVSFDHTFVSSNVPIKFVDAISPFFNKADDIYAVYKRLKMATREHSESVIYDLEEYIKVFKETIYKLKLKRIKGDFLGYLYGAFKNKCHELKYTYAMPEDSVYFDWLDESWENKKD